MGAITPEMLMRAYAMGVFPMSEHRNDPEIFWVDPKRRGNGCVDLVESKSTAFRLCRSSPTCQGKFQLER